MKLGIVGTGAMGKVVYDCAKEDDFFDDIVCIEPLDESTWPSEKLDALVDFSNRKAIFDIYDYCRKHGGNIPVVIATTGYERAEQEIVALLRKICPVDMRSNFSRGVEAVNKLAKYAVELLSEESDIRVFEAHHTRKKDAPSGTARTLCSMVGIDESEYNEKVAHLRMGSVFGEHRVYFAMEDEVVEISHVAYSKRIFAIGALAAVKELLKTTGV